MLESYRRIKIPDTQKYKNQQVRRQQTWSPPPEGWFKVNVIEDQVAGLGVVVADSNGNMVAAAFQKEVFQHSVAFMEAEAVKLGIHIAQSAGCSPLILESDSQEVVGLIQNKKGSKTEIFWTVLTIQDNLARMSQSRIQHVRRECNTIAHAFSGRDLSAPYHVTLFTLIL